MAPSLLLRLGCICVLHPPVRLPRCQWERICLPMQETQEMQIGSLGQEDPLEEGVATHSSILAGRIPWTEELQSMGSQRVGHD